MRAPRQAGITLIGLAATLTIGAILVALTGSSFASLVADNRLETRTQLLAASLNFARSEAVKRGARVTLCKSSDQTGCSTDSAAGWQVGWLVFVDSGAILGQIDAGEEILRSAASTDRLAISAAFDLRLSFTSTGAGVGDGGVSRGDFVLCDGRGEAHARKVSVGLNGQVSTRGTVGPGQC